MIFIQAVIGGGPELEYLKMKIDDKYIGMTLLAAFLGFWVSKYFIDLTAAQLNLLDLEIINFKNGLFSEYDLMFALTIGLLPLMYLITEKLGKLKSTKQSYLALAIIFISGILMWQFEIFTTKRMADYIATAFSKYNIHNQISIESLKLGKHFAIGCLLGTGLSSFIFRKINKEQTNNFTTIENPNETSKEISFGT